MKYFFASPSLFKSLVKLSAANAERGLCVEGSSATGSVPREAAKPMGSIGKKPPRTVLAAL